MDISIFNVLEDNEEDRYRVLARRVRRLGVRYLLEARREGLPNRNIQFSSPFEDLPSNQQFCDSIGLELEDLKQVDSPFVNDIAELVRSELKYTKEKRHPLAPQWHDARGGRYGKALPAFLYGGGALSDFYGNILRGFEKPENAIPYRLRFNQIQLPDNIRTENLSMQTFARLSVAYGLSLDYFNISQIRRKAEIRDVDLPTTELDRRFYL